MNLSLYGFMLYFFIVGCIAYISYLAKRNKPGSYGNMMLGNRSVNYFLTALSAHASDMSDWIFMAFPAYVYTKGGLGAWIALGLIGGMWITWKYIAPRLRAVTQQYNALTLSGYFEHRFSDTSGTIRVLVALICFLFFSVYIAAGLKGFGYLTESLFQIPYQYGIGIAIGMMMIYTMAGGYTGLAWIDAFQALFLLSVIIVVPCMAVHNLGGLSVVQASITEHNLSWFYVPKTLVDFINALCIALSWGVGYFGMPHILTKFMGITDTSEIKKAQYLGLSWQTLVMMASGLVGFVGLAYFPYTLANKELVFVAMVQDMFSPLGIGIILSAVAGATLAAMSAQVLVLTSVVVEDLYHKTWNNRATDNQLMWVYRVTIVLVGLLGLLVSLDRSTSIQQLVQYAWMGFGCSFGPLVLLSLYRTTITYKGALCGILTGALIAATWHSVGQPYVYALSGLDIPAVIPGFIVSSMVIYLSSLR